MAIDRLIYMPLGGAGEIGMNAYVYGYGPPGAERLILVDLGVTFPDMDGTPGVDLILPDIAWLRENADRLEAVFITHAHEDHVGAVGHYAGLLDVPVHARVFTANIARRKLEDAGLSTDILRIAAPWPARSRWWKAQGRIIAPGRWPCWTDCGQRVASRRSGSGCRARPGSASPPLPRRSA